jgi:nucleoside-diphosphate-sugar epimerase
MKKMEGVNVVYGDLTVYDDVLRCVKGADVVLHVGGMVSPAADYHPKRTLEVNVTAVKNIIKAIKAQPHPDCIKLVYIGTVAETGGRNAPIHWGRTGDPIKISVYDFYALSKVLAGHWSPKSLPLPWNYDEEAQLNPFFAQVWYPHHDKAEHNVYDERILKDQSYAAI